MSNYSTQRVYTYVVPAYNIFDFTSLLKLIYSGTLFYQNDKSWFNSNEWKKVQLCPIVKSFALTLFLSYKWLNLNLLQPEAIVARYIHFFCNPYRSERLGWEKEQIQMSSGLWAQFSLVYLIFFISLNDWTSYIQAKIGAPINFSWKFL